MNWSLAVGVALAGSLALACASEQRTEDGAEDPRLIAEQRPGEGQPPAGAEPPSVEQPLAGEQRPASERHGAPWVPPKPGCTPQTTSIYYTGILLSMTTGEASCSRQILVCGDSIRSDKQYNSTSEKCPWADGPTIAFREDGAEVCCDEWEKAKQSKAPCDPLADADCDGILNDDDVDTLTAEAPAPD
jgi:hypothetical protein